MSISHPGLSPSGQITYCQSYLRRTKSVAELEALADQVFQSATEEVTITQVANNGSMSTGTVTFPKSVLGYAVEGLLREAAVLGLAGASRLPAIPGPILADFSGRLIRS